MVKFELVVTRHQALVDFLLEEGLINEDTKVVDHVEEDDVRGLNVLGVLPHSLSCLTSSFTELPLTLPKELRGKELSVDDVRKYSGELMTYRVMTEEAFQEGLHKIDQMAATDGCSQMDWIKAF